MNSESPFKKRKVETHYSSDNTPKVKDDYLVEFRVNGLFQLTRYNHRGARVETIIRPVAEELIWQDPEGHHMTEALENRRQWRGDHELKGFIPQMDNNFYKTHVDYYK